MHDGIIRGRVLTGEGDGNERCYLAILPFKKKKKNVCNACCSDI